MQRRAFLAGLASTSLAGLAGCTGGGGDTPTASPTPPSREFPYTAASPSGNVNPRSLSLNNRTPQEYEASVAIVDTEADRTVLDRTVAVPGETEHEFEDIIRKVGTYRIRFELAVGVEKRYEWPIDEDHGDASVTVAEGGSPTDPVIWYSIRDL